ncbi:hypothetical protein [Salinirubrum litoreum]|uniref:YtkA-like domain-containing protein n=1 Tax=Salinirubrum litoreum TaxID=1126234 RepID=A0ABD5RAJ1_9EURY|nr:hypothetical protein [Salinirubrum litoreum]
MIALSVGGITLLAGCGGPTPDFEGPSGVRVINDHNESHTARITVETDGRTVFDRRISVDGQSSTTIPEQMPGRKLLGRRTYTVSAELETGVSTTREFEYDGMHRFVLRIEEDGSLELSTYEPV